MRLTPRVAGFRSEYPAGFKLECMAGFVGTRTRPLAVTRAPTRRLSPETEERLTSPASANRLRVLETVGGRQAEPIRHFVDL